MKIQKKHKIAVICFGIPLLIFLFVEYNTKRIVVKEISIYKENLSSSVTNLKILQLSDFHYKGNDSYFKKIIKKANSLKPDLIFLTGDYVERIKYYNKSLTHLSGLRAKFGIYAITGNWEYWGNLDLDKFKIDLQNIGIQLLINELVYITINNYKIYIYGVDDYFNKNWDFSPLQNIEKSDNLKFVLAHEPIYFKICTNKFDIMLSGHTHGGQIKIPLIGPLWLPDGSSHYVSGIYTNKNRTLYVNKGLGTSIHNIRLFAQPEITIIRYRK